MLGLSSALALLRIYVYIAFIHSAADREIKWEIKKVNKWLRKPQPDEYKATLLDCKSALCISSCIVSR